MGAQDDRARSGWEALVASTSGCFSRPGFALFSTLMAGWVLAPGRRTITAIVSVADPAGRRAHDAYHRFVRDGVWAMAGLWRLLATLAVARFAPEGVIALDCDDTLFHKSGRNIDGAGVFRDAVRSSGKSVVYAMGLNLVVVTLRVRPPWGGCPIGIPVNARLHRKADPTTTAAHAAGMINELAGWLPERSFHLCADGAYASLAGAGLARTTSPPACAVTPLSMRPPRPPPAGAGGPGPKASAWPPRPGSRPRPAAMTGNA